MFPNAFYISEERQRRERKTAPEMRTTVIGLVHQLHHIFAEQKVKHIIDRGRVEPCPPVSRKHGRVQVRLSSQEVENMNASAEISENVRIGCERQQGGDISIFIYPCRIQRQ